LHILIITYCISIDYNITEGISKEIQKSEIFLKKALDSFYLPYILVNTNITICVKLYIFGVKRYWEY